MSVSNLQERLEALKKLNRTIFDLEHQLNWESDHLGIQSESEREYLHENHMAAEDSLNEIKYDLKLLLKTELYNEEQKEVTVLLEWINSIID